MGHCIFSLFSVHFLNGSSIGVWDDSGVFGKLGSMLCLSTTFLDSICFVVDADNIPPAKDIVKDGKTTDYGYFSCDWKAFGFN
jgi:hypothetical protein